MTDENNELVAIVTKHWGKLSGGVAGLGTSLWFLVPRLICVRDRFRKMEEAVAAHAIAIDDFKKHIEDGKEARSANAAQLHGLAAKVDDLKDNISRLLDVMLNRQVPEDEITSPGRPRPRSKA